MNQIIQLRTRYLVNLELQADQRRRRHCAWMASIALFLAGLCVLALTGCKNPGGAIPLPLVTSTVALGVSDAILLDPASRPLLSVSGSIICAESRGTNITPADLVAKLEAAGVLSASNKIAVVVVNNALFLYDGVVQSYGLSVSNTPVFQGYLGAICAGFERGLPLPSPTARKAAMAVPHLK